jgi:hypothetical protein
MLFSECNGIFVALLSSRGGIGRHARLRGVWEKSRGSSNLLVSTLLNSPFCTFFGVFDGLFLLTVKSALCILLIGNGFVPDYGVQNVVQLGEIWHH